MDAKWEKIDAIRTKTHVTYRKATEALDRAAGDVRQAIRDLRQDAGRTDVLKVRGEDLLRTLATVIRRGNASRIIVRSGMTVVADMPVTAGVVSAILAPWFTLLATIALLVSTWTVEIERPMASRREPLVP